VERNKRGEVNEQKKKAGKGKTDKAKSTRCFFSRSSALRNDNEHQRKDPTKEI